MYPIHRLPKEKLEELMTKELFEREKPNNYQYYENGKTWTDERTKRALSTKIDGATKWEETGNPKFISWYIIADKETYVGFIGAYFHPSGEKEGYVEIACARNTYNHRLNGMMPAALKAFCSSFGPGFRDLGEEFKGLYAPINPDNIRSIRVVSKFNFTLEKYCPENNRNHYILPREEFFKNFQ